MANNKYDAVVSFRDKKDNQITSFYIEKTTPAGISSHLVSLFDKVEFAYGMMQKGKDYSMYLKQGRNETSRIGIDNQQNVPADDQLEFLQGLVDSNDIKILIRTLKSDFADLTKEIRPGESGDIESHFSKADWGIDFSVMIGSW